MTDLKMEVATLKQQHDVAQHEIRIKEDRINQLIREIHNLVNNILSSFVCFSLSKIYIMYISFCMYRKRDVAFLRQQ